MTATSPSEPLAGVGATAIGVALIRARETDRADRLYDDPYAHAFADAARTAFLDPRAPADAADRWATIERLVDPFYEWRTVSVRLVDDRVRDWIAAGCEQVVVLGAGLDTRAFRLPLSRELQWFEVDLPDMFAFKEPALERLGAVPACDRRVVPTDLRADWTTALLEAGFRPTVPTAWIEEGVIGYLPQDQAEGVATTVTALSASGSRFSTPRFEVNEDQPHYQKLKQLAFDKGRAAPPLRGLGPDAEHWLNRYGWQTEFRTWDELIKPFGRPVASGNPDNGTILAVRE